MSMRFIYCMKISLHHGIQKFDTAQKQLTTQKEQQNLTRKEIDTHSERSQ